MSIDVLREIAGVLDNKGVAYWVTGGYALDIAVGRLTREHKNIDLLVKVSDAGKVKTILEDNGYLVTYSGDKFVAVDGGVINLLIMDEFRDDYVIQLINVEVRMPKNLMNKEVRDRLGDYDYKRVPNELIYLLMRHSMNTSDSLISRNLPVKKNLMKSIDVNIKRR